MASKKSSGASENTGTIIRFTLTSFTGFCLALVAGALLFSYALNRFPGFHPHPTAAQASAGVVIGKPGPWGEFMVQQIQLERPQEYLEFETKTNRQITWN